MCGNSRQRVIHISSAVAVIFLESQVACAVNGGEHFGGVSCDHHVQERGAVTFGHAGGERAREVFESFDANMLGPIREFLPPASPRPIVVTGIH